MAITKILARKGRLDAGIKYILNGDKTEEQILTAHLNCAPGRECRQMLDTKRAYGKTDRVAYRRTDTPPCPFFRRPAWYPASGGTPDRGHSSGGR